MGRFITTLGDNRPAKRPEPGVFISGVRDDYVPEHARLGLDPAKLGNAMRRADSGDHVAQQEIFSACLEDAHVHSVFSKRTRRVLSRTLHIIPAIEDDERSQAAADLVREMVLGDAGRPGIAGWRQALRDLSEAVFRGFALSQIVWQADGARWRPARLRWWDQRDCVLGGGWMARTDYDADEVRVITDAQRTNGEALEPNQWVLHVQKARSAPLARAALGRMVVWWWLFKKFGTKDWMIFCDRYGMPLRLGKYPRGAQDDERAALYRAVLSLGKDGGAVLPEGTAIEFVEAATRGELPYPPMIETCDFQISKAILGGTLTTDAGDRGARSLGEVHERNETDIANDDGHGLSETLRQQLFAPIVGFNLGWDYPVPYCEFPSEEQENLLERAQRDKILAKDLGLPIAKRQMYDVYGIEEPGADDEVLAPPKPQPSPFARGAAGDEDQEPADDEAEEMAARLGLDLRDVRALAAAKKKSRAWAT